MAFQKQIHRRFGLCLGTAVSQSADFFLTNQWPQKACLASQCHEIIFRNHNIIDSSWLCSVRFQHCSPTLTHTFYSTGPLLRLPLPSKIITIMRCLDLWFLSPLGRHDTGLKFASVFRRMPVQHTMASKRQRWSHSMTKHGQVNAVFSWYLPKYFYAHMYMHKYKHVYLYTFVCAYVYTLGGDEMWQLAHGPWCLDGTEKGLDALTFVFCLTSETSISYHWHHWHLSTVLEVFFSAPGLCTLVSSSKRFSSGRVFVSCFSCILSFDHNGPQGRPYHFASSSHTLTYTRTHTWHTIWLIWLQLPVKEGCCR